MIAEHWVESPVLYSRSPLTNHFIYLHVHMRIPFRKSTQTLEPCWWGHPLYDLFRILSVYVLPTVLFAFEEGEALSVGSESFFPQEAKAKTAERASASTSTDARTFFMSITPFFGFEPLLFSDCVFGAKKAEPVEKQAPQLQRSQSLLNPFGHRKTDDTAAARACHHAHAHYSGNGHKCGHCEFSFSLGFMTL